MKSHTHIIKWASDCLTLKNYLLQGSPEPVVETPWSTVIRFSTSQGTIYLKQMPSLISLEPKIMQLLASNFNARVPEVIAINTDLHCFLMKEAGQSLRAYLKTNFQPELMCRAITEFTSIQRATENKVKLFFTLDVPDWRLNQFSLLYNQLLEQEEFLKGDGITDQELRILGDLSPKISEQCESLAKYQIAETLVQSDFHTNNILFEPATQTLTFIDLGEIEIAHPFFSLHTFIRQTHIHHEVKEFDQIYYQLQEACYKNWPKLSETQFLEAFSFAQELWPIYSAFGAYRLMRGVDLQAFKSFYAHRPHRLVGYFREYLSAIE